MRILFIQKRTNRGGSKVSLLNTIKLLTGAGCEVNVLCSAKGPFTDWLEQNGIPYFVSYVPEYRKLTDRIRFSRCINRIASTLPGKNFDWVISNEMWWGPAAAALAARAGARSAVILRDTLTGTRKLKKYDLQKHDRVLCINPVMTGWVKELHGEKTDARTIFNPVTLPDPDPNGIEHWKNVLDAWPRAEKIFLTTGRLGPRKNQIDAVRTLHLLGKKPGGNYGVVFAGGGDKKYIARMRKTAAKLSVADKVLMPGYIDNIRGLLETANYFLFTSVREGLPRAVIEAMLAGLPVFSYPLPGLKEIYGEYHPMFVSKEPTPLSLSNTAETALADEKLPQAAEVLRERAMARFSEDKHLKRFLSILSD